MKRGDRTALAAGFVGGLVVGWLTWSAQIQRSRRDLFNRSPVRRVAALGYLNGRPGIQTVQLLAEYVKWEHRPQLRRRGRRMLRRMQASLE